MANDYSLNLANKVIKLNEDMDKDRSTFENVWQQISEFVLPNRGDFTFERAKGARADYRVFDTTAIQANEMLAAAIHGGLMNPASNWFNLSAPDPKTQQNEAVRDWIDSAQRVMMQIFNSKEANFYQQSHELLLDLVAYGTAAMYIDEEVGSGVRFITRHLSEIRILEDSKGNVDTISRKFKFTARQAMQEWEDANFGPQLRSAAATEQNKEFCFVHLVMPRKDAIKLDGSIAEKIPSSKKFVSLYVCEEDKCVINVSGFYENPYIIVRWEKLVGETYGRSPAWNALSDIRMINVMSEVMIRAAQKQVDPPLLVADDGVIMPLHTRPSGVNVGGVSMDGRPLIQPLQTGGNLNVGLEMMNQRRDAIRQAYFVDQFVRKEGTPVTATEAIQNQENSLRLTGPQLSRVEVEFLAKVIDRVFAIAQRAGQFEQAPEELADVDLKIEYSSPLAKTQRVQELVSLNRALESASILIESSPDLLQMIDDASYFREVLDISGVSSQHVRGKKEFESLREASREQQEQQAGLDQAEQGSQVAANLTKAGVEL